MKKETVEKWMKRYLAFRAKIIPILYNRFYEVQIEEHVWDTVKDLPMYQFSSKINSYGYIPDRGMGLLDCSFNPNHPDYFFQELQYGRDCDDFARIWRLWAEHQGMTAWEYVITDVKHPISKAHVICVAQDKSHGKNAVPEYWIFDYEPIGPFDSIQTLFTSLNERHEGDSVMSSTDISQNLFKQEMSQSLSNLVALELGSEFVVYRLLDNTNRIIQWSLFNIKEKKIVCHQGNREEFLRLINSMRRLKNES